MPAYGTRENPVRFSFPHLAEPAPINEKTGIGGKYGIQVIIPKSDTALVERIKKDIEEAKQKGIDAKMFNRAITQSAEFRNCLRDGDLKAEEVEDGSQDYLKGCFFINANANPDTQGQPKVKDNYNRAVPQEDIKRVVYPGCYGIVNMGLYPYKHGKGGIGAGLNGVMKLRDGERLDGRSDVEKEFEELADKPEAAFEAENESDLM